MSADLHVDRAAEASGLDDGRGDADREREPREHIVGVRCPSLLLRGSTSFSRWWWIVRCHRKSQLALRALGIARRRVERWFPQHLDAPRGGTPATRPNVPMAALWKRKLDHLPVESSAAVAARVALGRFRFLRHELLLPDPVDWRLSSHRPPSQLWRFHLHYHEFLADLAAAGCRTGEPAWFERGWDLIGQWVAGNDPSDPRAMEDSWHPYCISRRLPAWMLFWSASPPSGERRNVVLRGIASQAEHLARHLEWDLGGNHLIENAVALVLAGAFLEGPDANRWLTRGERILRREIPRQILPHGEHEERCPTYHARMLECILDVRDVVANCRPALAGLCANAAQRMAEFLAEILHPDGQIPLLGDSCLAATPRSMPLIARARDSHAPAGRDDEVLSESQSSRSLGPYWIHRHGDEYLLFDAGPVGPDHLPAHAHADLLSIEASLGGQRLLVDAGAYCYEDDGMRQYCRSSLAHNVPRIDEQNQCDVWSRFRMGYRGWPRGFDSGGQDGFSWARAEHNAYRRLGVPRVGRWLACRPGGPWLCVDWARGGGEHRFTNLLRFHPTTVIERVGADTLRIVHQGQVLHLHWLTPGMIRLTEGWYCPEFGLRIACPVVEWTATTGLPVYCGWAMTWRNSTGRAILDTAAADRPRLRWMEEDFETQFRLG